MTNIRKKSKYYGKSGNKPACDDNPNRRVQIPDWRFYASIIEYIEDGAKIHGITRGRFFETVVKNYFLLNPTFIVANYKIDNSCIENKSKRLKFYMHPTYIEMIKKYAAQSNCTATRYLTLLFQNYKVKYWVEIDLNKVL